MDAVIEHIFLKIARGEPMLAVPQAQAVRDRGLVGDRAYGRRGRQVLLMDSETLAEFGLAAGDVRENLTTSGLDLAALEAGDELQIGEIALLITGSCAPCSQLEALRTGLRESIDGRRGLLAQVVAGGTLQVGDPIRVRAQVVDSRSTPEMSAD